MSEDFNFTRRHIRREVAKLRSVVDEQCTKICELPLALNTGGGSISGPGYVNDCLNEGIVHIGKNSRLIGSSIAKNCELTIGDNCTVVRVVCDGVGAIDNVSGQHISIKDNSFIFHTRIIGQVTIGDSSILMHDYLDVNKLTLGKKALVFSTKICGEINLLHEQIIYKTPNVSTIGDNVTICGVRMDMRFVRKFSIGDDFIMCSRAGVINTAEALRVCTLPESYTIEEGGWEGLTPMEFQQTVMARKSSMLHQLKEVRIGSNVTIAGGIRFNADKFILIGDDVSIFSGLEGNINAKGEREDYSRCVGAEWVFHSLEFDKGAQLFLQAGFWLDEISVDLKLEENSVLYIKTPTALTCDTVIRIPANKVAFL